MSIDDIKLPMNLTLADLVKSRYIKWLAFNQYTADQEKNGNFSNIRVQNMWVACQVGANQVVEVLEERLSYAAEQRVLMEARIKQLEAQVAGLTSN